MPDSSLLQQPPGATLLSAADPDKARPQKVQALFGLAFRSCRTSLILIATASARNDSWSLYLMGKTRVRPSLRPTSPRPPLSRALEPPYLGLQDCTRRPPWARPLPSVGESPSEEVLASRGCETTQCGNSRQTTEAHKYQRKPRESLY